MKLSKVFNDMVGKPYDAAEVKKEADKAGFTRVRRQPTMGTCDHRTDRLNVLVDPKGIIEKFYVG